VCQASPAGTPTTESASDTMNSSWADVPIEDDASEPLTPSCQSSGGFSCASTGTGRLAQELEFLRSENAKLRNDNCLLETRAFFNDAALRAELFQTPAKLPPSATETLGVFDNPFEPPPEMCRYWPSSPACSTPGGSYSFGSGSLTPFSESSLSCAASGYVTPVPALAGQPMVTLVPLSVPVWFQTIPSGVVKQARTMFEHHAVIPSWFAQK